MIGVQFEVTTDDGAVHGETSARSVVDYERQFDGSVLGLFTGAGRIEGMYWLAWRSLQLDGSPLGELTFDEFIDALVDFRVVEEDDDVQTPEPPGGRVPRSDP